MLSRFNVHDPPLQSGKRFYYPMTHFVKNYGDLLCVLYTIAPFCELSMHFSRNKVAFFGRSH